MIIYNYNLHIQTEEKIFKEHKRRVHNCFISSCHSESHLNTNIIIPDSTIYVTLKYNNFNNAINIAKLIFSGDSDIFYEVKSDLIKISGLDKKFDDIYFYLNQNIGYLRLFFTEVRGICPFSTIVPNLSSHHKTDPVEAVKAALDSYSDQELFSLLLKSLHLYADVQPLMINYATQSKENFIMFLQGAAYSQDAKQQLWEIFSLGIENTTLKDKLLSFINDYYKYYSQLYASQSCRELS